MLWSTAQQKVFTRARTLAAQIHQPEVHLHQVISQLQIPHLQFFKFSSGAGRSQ